MAEIPLVAAVRGERGSRSSRRLLHAGHVPGVVYGHGVAPVSVSVNARELRGALSGGSGVHALIDLDVAGTHHLVIARDLQRDPVRQTVSHVDFHVVRRDEVVSAEVALGLTGDTLAVTRAGGTVEHLVLAVSVKAKPADIPTHLELDVSGLEIGSVLHLADVPLPRGVALDGDPDTAVVVAHPPKGASAGADGEVPAEPSSES